MFSTIFELSDDVHQLLIFSLDYFQFIWYYETFFESFEPLFNLEVYWFLLSEVLNFYLKYDFESLWIILKFWIYLIYIKFLWNNYFNFYFHYFFWSLINSIIYWWFFFEDHPTNRPIRLGIDVSRRNIKSRNEIKNWHICIWKLKWTTGFEKYIIWQSTYN